MDKPPVVSAEEWQQARDALLTDEKQATRTLDQIAARRRRLPMVKFRSDSSCSVLQRSWWIRVSGDSVHYRPLINHEARINHAK